jgi:hypothetical protein
MDRWKTDVIASLPLQPGGCALYLFGTFRETNLGSDLGFEEIGRENVSTSYAGEKWSARQAKQSKEN